MFQIKDSMRKIEYHLTYYMNNMATKDPLQCRQGQSHMEASMGCDSYKLFKKS